MIDDGYRGACMSAQISPTHDTASRSFGGWREFIEDWSSDREAFRVSWGKAMMWIFLLSDTFIFSCFLTGYMTVRISSTVPWPNPSKVFALNFGGADFPLTPSPFISFVLI